MFPTQAAVPGSDGCISRFNARMELGASTLWLRRFGGDASEWGRCFCDAKRRLIPKDRLRCTVIIGFDDALKYRGSPIRTLALILEDDCNRNVRLIRGFTCPGITCEPGMRRAAA